METETKTEQTTSDLITQQNELLRRNLEMSEKILEKTEIIKKYIKWQKIWSIIRLLIIAIPLIIGFLYLPPIIKNYLSQYSSLY